MQAPISEERKEAHVPSAYDFTFLERNWVGPLKVTGQMGSGKSTGARIRACYLASAVPDASRVTILVGKPEEKIAFRDQFRAECPGGKRVEIQTFSTWVQALLHELGTEMTVLTDGVERQQLWERAFAHASPDIGLPLEFYITEFDQVITPSYIRSAAEYATVQRSGRGERLTKSLRRRIWPVFVEYFRLLEEANMYDVTALPRRLLPELHHVANRPYHLVVDDAQLLTKNQFALIRAAVPTGPNDLSLFHEEDPGSTRSTVVYRDVGIEVRGRSFQLEVFKR